MLNVTIDKKLENIGNITYIFHICMSIGEGGVCDTFQNIKKFISILKIFEISFLHIIIDSQNIVFSSDYNYSDDLFSVTKNFQKN